MTTKMEHRPDLAEAYALNALDPEERAVFEEHLAVCSECHRLAQLSEQAAELLALAAPPAAPPLRCKRNVLARIEREEFLRAPARTTTRRRIPLSTWAATAAALLCVVFGGWAFSLQGQLQQARDEITMMRAQMDQMRGTVAQFASFGPAMADGQEICVMKNPQRRVAAKCFARPGDDQAVMVAAGLPSPPQGKQYQLWVANEEGQQPLDVFEPHDGVAVVPIDPPASLDHYTEIMVTVEDAGGAQTPTIDTTILAGNF